MNITIIIILGIVIVLLISSIILLILYIIKFRKYEEKYHRIWNKFENKNIETDIENLINYMAETRKISEEAKITSDNLEAKTIKNLQKLGFVRYDAYEEGNNELSFSLAILDAKDDGILVNNIYTRNGSNIYAKQIKEGAYEGNLSKEEEKALQNAKNSKTFM